MHWDAAVGQWLVTRFDDVHDAFRDTRRFSSFGWQIRYFERVPPAIRARVPTLEERGATPNLVTSDPPAHTRVRRMLQAAFTPKAIELLRPRIEALVGELLDDAEARGAARPRRRTWPSRCRPASSRTCSAPSATIARRSASGRSRSWPS